MGKFKIEMGDITTYAVDGIVNAANTTLLGGGGVDGAIHRAAGPELLEECKTLGGCDTGKAKITKGYNLPAHYVLHTPGPIWHGGYNYEDVLLQGCYEYCLKLGEQYGLKTIAFPSISTGVYGYPVEEAAKIAVRTICDFLKWTQVVEEVTMVCHGEGTWKVYQEAYREYQAAEKRKVERMKRAERSMYSGDCAGLHLSAFYTAKLWEVFGRMKKSYEMDMCTGPLLKKLLIFAVPLILSGVLQLLFNAADIVVVGKFAGSHALAAVGSTGALINLFTNVFIGFLLVPMYWLPSILGQRMNRTSRIPYIPRWRLASSAEFFLIVAGMIFAPMMLELMATPEEVLGQAALYIRIYFIGMPAMLIYNFGAAVLRAIGDTRRPLYYLLEAGVVNVILNLVFVIGFQMGVAGVAIATVVSQCISAALIVRCLMKSEGMYRLYLKRIRIHKEKMIRIIQIGLPAGLQGAIFSISNVLIQSSINSFGAIAMAGNTAAGNIEGFVYVSMNAIYQTALSFVSQNVGAGQQKRIPKISIYCMAIVFTVGLALGTLAYRCGGTLLGIYSSDPEVIAYGLDRMKVICQIYFLCGMMDVAVGILRGMGYSIMPMLVSLAGACGLRIVWIFTVFVW